MRYQDRVPRGPFIKPPAMRVVADSCLSGCFSTPLHVVVGHVNQRQFDKPYEWQRRSWAGMGLRRHKRPPSIPGSPLPPANCESKLAQHPEKQRTGRPFTATGCGLLKQPDKHELTSFCRETAFQAPKRHQQGRPAGRPKSRAHCLQRASKNCSSMTWRFLHFICRVICFVICRRPAGRPCTMSRVSRQKPAKGCALDIPPKSGGIWGARSQEPGEPTAARVPSRDWWHEWPRRGQRTQPGASAQRAAPGKARA